MILFGIIAVVNSLFSVWNLNQNLVAIYKNKGMAITKTIARSSSNLLFDHPYETIQAIIDAYLDTIGVAYIFVQDENQEIVAHTFVPTIPEDFRVND